MLIAVGNPKVVDPATDKLAGFKELEAHAYPPVTVGKFPYTLLELPQRFRVPLDLSAPEGEAQELTLSGLHHLAFLEIDHKLQVFLQVLSDAT